MNGVLYFVLSGTVLFLMGGDSDVGREKEKPFLFSAVTAAAQTEPRLPAKHFLEKSTGTQVSPAVPGNLDGKEENAVETINVQIGSSTFLVTLSDNTAADAFLEMVQNAPLILEMKDNGFEKVGTLAAGLPSSNQQMTAQAGDIVLYNGNQVVMFYGSNSWSYTKIGQVEDLSGWREALGGGDVQVTFKKD